jgi:uncharacterized protein YpbB
MFFETVVLACVKRLRGQRTIASVYHLLTGKKSIQTIQDAHVYELQNYYGICKKVPKNQFDRTINALQKDGFIQNMPNEQMAFSMTEKGSDLLHTRLHTFPLQSFRGMAYNGIQDLFYHRLILLIQTLTNSSKQYYTFIPVVDQKSAETWVKNVYSRVKGRELAMLQTLYQELYRLLSTMSDLEANLFVDRLSGYKQYGKSISQLAYHYNLQEVDVSLMLTSVIHQMLTIVKHNHGDFRLIQAMVPDRKEQTKLTNSTQRTYQLWCNGLTIDEMAKQRKLKVSTIHDHLVEIALFEKDFPLEHYVKKERIEQILKAMKVVRHFKLKDIKEIAGDEITYFEIRLVLAYHNHSKQGAPK